MKKEKRPKCPKCGGHRVWKNGFSWVCASCGKQWVMHPVKRPKLPTDRPMCPHCGSIGKTVKNGPSWLCNFCGKQWSKKIVPRTPLSPRPPCPYCDSRVVWSNGPFWRCTECNRTFKKVPTMNFGDIYQAKTIQI